MREEEKEASKRKRIQEKKWRGDAFNYI